MTVVRAAIRAAAVIAALVPIARFLSVAVARVRYPFDLEWMESGVVDHVRIVLSGQGLYRAPSLAFTPFIYPPFYYFVVALVSKVVGVGLFAPRLVSLASIVGCFALLADWVRRETGDWAAGAVAAGLFAATYGQCAFWFDLGRVDSLFLLLVLAGYRVVRFAETHRVAALGGAALALAVFTKQVGLGLALAPLLYLWLVDVRRGVWATAAFVGVVGGAFAALEVTSHGWFSFYALRVPADHEVDWKNWSTQLEEHLWTPVAPMALAGLAVGSGALPRRGWRVWALHAGWVAIAPATSLAAILHTGGYPNVLMPAYAALATASGVAFAALSQAPASGRAPASASAPAPSPAPAPWGGVFALVALAAQIAALWGGPVSPLIPSAADGEAGRQMLDAVKQASGPVWMISSGYYPLVARGDPVRSHGMAIVDVLKSKREAVKAKLLAELTLAIRSRTFGAIVLDRVAGFLPGPVVDEIHRDYRLERRLFAPGDPRLWPKVGAAVRPDELWVPTAGP
jgi:hypothetical protein